MGDFTNTITVDAPPDTLFDFLSDVHNLPKYFARMTSAEPGSGDEVHTTAKLPDGKQVEGDAEFHVDDERQRIEWGSEGRSEYHGYLDVRAAGDGSEVEVHLHTERVSDGDEQVEQGLQETLDHIKQLVEAA